MRSEMFCLLLLAACGEVECPRGSVEGLGEVCQWAGSGASAAVVQPSATAGKPSYTGGVFDDASPSGGGGSAGRVTDVEGTNAGGGGGGNVRGDSGRSDGGASGALFGPRPESIEPHDPTEQPDAGIALKPEPRCGDGHVDPGETCDGNCEAINCDDNELCTEEMVAGSPKTCDVICIRKTLEDGARCGYESMHRECRSGTCVSKCGNGKVEAPETCDGSCPTGCDDGNPCTADALEGSASTCTAYCRHVFLTASTPCPGGLCDSSGVCQR